MSRDHRTQGAPQTTLKEPYLAGKYPGGSRHLLASFCDLLKLLRGNGLSTAVINQAALACSLPAIGGSPRHVCELIGD